LKLNSWKCSFGRILFGKVLRSAGWRMPSMLSYRII
jgi:hypothetical protein